MPLYCDYLSLISGGNILYIFYTGPGGQYAVVASSKRNAKKVSKDCEYFGKVIDREAGCPSGMKFNATVLLLSA